MTKRKRLTPDQRREIVAAHRRGVPNSELAKDFDVTSRSIQYTLKKAEQGRRDSGIRTETMSVTLTPEEMARDRKPRIQFCKPASDAGEACGIGSGTVPAPVVETEPTGAAPHAARTATAAADIVSLR